MCTSSIWSLKVSLLFVSGMLSGALTMFVDVFSLHPVMFYHAAFWSKVGLWRVLGHGAGGANSG